MADNGAAEQRERSLVAFARAVLIALAPTTVAFAIQTKILAPTGSRWLLMIAAVVVSAANGGIASGLIATIVSAALVWWFLIPPRETFGAADPAHYLSATIFLAVAFAVSVLHERLRRTTDRLTKNQRVLRAVLDYSPNAIVIKRLDGRYALVNEEFAGLAHVTRDAAKGKTDVELFPAAVAARLRANDQQAIATREAVVTEETLDDGGGPRVFVVTKFPLFDATGAAVALCSIWTDITQRKHDEEALRRAASGLRTAQRVAHVGSWRWDVRTGEAVWSEELYHIFGLDPSQLRRTPPFLEAEAGVLTAESRAKARAAADNLLAGGSTYDIELEFTRPDGSSGWISARGETERDESGQIVALNGTAADITKVKRLQRLRDEWTSIIAHDLRQPIGTILMASGILPELVGEMSDDARSMVQRIHDASLSLKRLVDDLLDLSLLEANRLKLERKWTEPSAIARGTIEHLAHLPGIERVHFEEDGALPAVFVDPMRVRQVLANLVSNAIKYGDPKTDVVVRATRAGNGIEFTVMNRGCGIPPDELPQLFHRFARSTTVHGSGVRGLGLGLYIAKGVVDAHGGRIWAESTPGKETTFHVLLPSPVELHEAA